VRAIGLLKSFHDKKHLNAFNIHPVEDFNEVTHHSLEAIHAHLYNTKGPFATNGAGQQRSPVKLNNFGQQPQAQAGRAQQNGGFQHQQQAPTYQQQQKSAQDVLKDNIVAILAQNNDESGVSVATMCDYLKDTATAAQVRAALEELNSDVRIYNTVDDEHFGLTG